MADQAETHNDTDPVADAARAAFAQADGDVARATRLMEGAVRADRTLRDELTDPLISDACYSAIRLQCRVARGRVWRSSRREIARHQTEGVRRLVSRAETLLAFPLLGGRHLRDAQKPEIITAAEFYERQAGDMAVKGRWLRLVASRLPGTRRVADVLSEGQLRLLQVEARDHG